MWPWNPPAFTGSLSARRSKGHFALTLANPYQVKNIPGRKTDSRDSHWLAELLAHGLIQPRFVPPREVREQRDLTRYRVKLTEERNRVHNRIHKILDDACIKLDTVATDILGATGRAIVQAIINWAITTSTVFILSAPPTAFAEIAEARAGRISSALGSIPSALHLIADCPEKRPTLQMLRTRNPLQTRYRKIRSFRRNDLEEAPPRNTLCG